MFNKTQAKQLPEAYRWQYACCLSSQILGKNLLLQEQALTCLAILTLFAYFKGQELHCHGISQAKIFHLD